MQGGATGARRGRIGEERRRRRRPRAAATARGGWPFAPHSFAAKRSLFKEASFASPVAKGQTRRPRPFFSSLLNAPDPLRDAISDKRVPAAGEPPLPLLDISCRGSDRGRRPVACGPWQGDAGVARAR